MNNQKRKNRDIWQGNLSRREFIKLSFVMLAASSIKGYAPFNENIESFNLPRRRLGRTGLKTGIVGLGGAFALAGGKEKASAVIEKALNLEVNFIDSAPTYGNSEKNIGAALKDRRGEVYISTKTLERSYDGTMRLFEQSLERLQTEYIDLYQIHGLHNQDDLIRIFDEGGAVKALEKLKEDGRVKFIGVTGHRNTEVMIKAIEEYDFDTIQVPINAADALWNDSFIRNVLPIAREKNMGIIGIKVPAYGNIFKKGGINTMKQALGYTLSMPVSTALIGVSSLQEIQENVNIARKFKPFSETELENLQKKTEPNLKEINFFRRW